MPWNRGVHIAGDIAPCTSFPFKFNSSLKLKRDKISPIPSLDGESLEQTWNKQICYIALRHREPFAPSRKGHQVKEAHGAGGQQGQQKAVRQERKSRLVAKPQDRPTVYQSQHMKPGIDSEHGSREEEKIKASQR